MIETHQPLRQHVKDRARGVRDDVERELRPLERSIVRTDSYRNGRALEGGDEPILRASADRRKCETTPIGSHGRPIRVALDGNGQCTRYDSIGPESGREQLFVTHAVLRREYGRAGRIAERRAQRRDCGFRIVGLNGYEREVYIRAHYIFEAPRRVRNVRSRRAQRFAEKPADGARTDDVDPHLACLVMCRSSNDGDAYPVEPNPPEPRCVDSVNSSTTRNSGRTIGTKSICAIRSPGSIRIASEPLALLFQTLIKTGPV